MFFTVLISWLVSGYLDVQVGNFSTVQVEEQEQSGVIARASDFVENSLFGNESGETDIRVPVIVDKHNLGPILTAKASIVIDGASGALLWGNEINDRHPIASISKLMAVMVYLDQNPDLSRVITMTKEDETSGGRQYLGRGEKVLARDLVYSALVTSDNNATEALARVSGLDRSKFIDEMNIKAQVLGMSKSSFVEPTGLEFTNVASPRDVVVMLEEALSYELIASAVKQKTYTFTSVSGKEHKVYNTNKLLGGFINIIGGKTGFNGESLYNLVIAVKGDEGQIIYVVVLGSATVNDRFEDAKVLADWVLSNYKWD